MGEVVKKFKRSLRAKLIESAVLMLICVVILLYSVFAWFSSNKNITASGMSISLGEQASLNVTAKQDAVNEALTVAEVTDNAGADRLFQLSVDSGTAMISPGSAGQFSFWVTAHGASSVKVTPTVCAGGITTVRNAQGNATSFTAVANNGYREGTTPAAMGIATGYLQGHILLFTEKTTENSSDVYSGWIDPFTGIVLDVTNGVKTEFTVYWVWVDSYSKLCAGSRLINNNDITLIQERFSQGEYLTTNLLDSRDNNIEDASYTLKNHYYDFADADIGTAVSHVYFNLQFGF